MFSPLGMAMSLSSLMMEGSPKSRISCMSSFEIAGVLLRLKCIKSGSLPSTLRRMAPWVLDAPLFCKPIPVVFLKNLRPMRVV